MKLCCKDLGESMVTWSPARIYLTSVLSLSDFSQILKIMILMPHQLRIIPAHVVVHIILSAAEINQVEIYNSSARAKMITTFIEILSR